MVAASAPPLKVVLAQLERGERASGADDQARVCKELLDIGRAWPEEAAEDEAHSVEKLTKQLARFTDAQQQDIVCAFRPLRDSIRQRMVESTVALNRWLSDAQEPEKASVQKLTELLQGFDEAPWLRCYKQCSDLAAKAPFLVAAASVLRALQGEAAPLRAQLAAHPRAVALARRISDKLFVIPRLGNILTLWHDGRLERYNRTLWRAARRAADRLRDDLQVRLVSALRRATAPVQLAGGKSKPQLQLELRAWPMVGCPLAKSFLDFVAQRGHELGDLGKPSLAECPPHSLQPRTLRRLLSRLEAFEILDSDKPSQSEKLGVVCLRWKAVAALAFKAVGTKPKAAAQAATVAAAAGAGAKGSPPPELPKASLAGQPPRSAGHPPRPGQRPGFAAGEAKGAAPELVQRKIDWGNAESLLRLVRRGLCAADEEWRQGWQLFCKQKRLPAELGQGSHSKDALAEFLERNLSKLLKKEWAKDLMYKVKGGRDAPPPESEAEEATRAAAAPANSSDVVALTAQAKAKDAGGGTGSAVGGRKRLGSRSREASSSASDSSRSKRKRRRRREKRKLGAMLGYGDYFGRGQKDLHISPEVMMMNQMMGMSMMMNNPLAMMGMGAPIMAHQMPMMQTAAGLKPKKEDKGKREKPEDKAKLSARDRKAEPAAAMAICDAKPAAKDGKLDWSKRKEAMIDADDL